MSFRGPSVGPFQVAELDVHLVNEIFRQIEELLKQFIGLAGTIQFYNTIHFDDSQYATVDELANVAASESAGISDLIPRGDHVHAHGSGYLPDAHHIAFEDLQANGVDVALASRKINLIAGTGITLTPAAGSITIDGSGSSGGGSATGTENVTDVDGSETHQPWELLTLNEDTMSGTEQAEGNAFQLKALQVVVAGDELVGDLQPLTDGNGNLVYA